MVVGDVPVWSAITIAGIGMIGALAGSIGTALVNRSNQQAGLRQELLLHSARERINVLEEAISLASAYREQVASALRFFNRNRDRDFSGEPLWIWTSEEVQPLKSQEVSLKLRFWGKPVTARWEYFEWILAEAAVFCESNGPIDEHSDQPIADEVQREAKRWRDATSDTLKYFIESAGETLVTVQPPEERISQIRRWLAGRGKEPRGQ
jgi:hypothetical protein